ncbi:MAG: hypothetical protein AAF211_16670 [Myxococcota bacterium]
MHYYFGLLFAVACGPKVPGATSPATSSDLGTVAGQVVQQLPAWEGFAGFEEPPHIVVLPTENTTKFKFDSHVATAKLVNGLILRAEGRYDVVDPDTWATLSAAPASKPAAPPAADATDDAEPMPTEDAADVLVLHSAVQSTETASGDGRSAVHVLVTYRLVESDTARALWGWSSEWVKVKGDDGFELLPQAPTAPATPAVPILPTGS